MENKDIFTLKDAQRTIGPRAFSTLIKPFGSTCNLDCTYCYYIDKALQYGGLESMMPEPLLENYFRQYIGAVETGSVDFCWHGGEPLLCGKEYLRKAVALQKKYAGNKAVTNSIQTNGTLVDEDWCRFFADNGFLVGLSIDGPADIHDAFRINKGGDATFARVMKTVELLHRFDVQFNTLSVVSALSENRGAEIYRFLRDDAGSRFMQFLPAVEKVVDVPGLRRPVIVNPGYKGARIAEWSVSPEGYGRFLCDVFDEWYANDVGTCFVQIFEATAAQLAGLPPGICTLGETCGDGLAVEHNGDVFPCDHFVYQGLKLGNIKERTISDMYDSPERLKFALFKRNSLPRECLACGFFRLCHGECPKHRFDAGPNYLCKGLKMFFEHSSDKLGLIVNSPNLVLKESIGD